MSLPRGGFQLSQISLSGRRVSGNTMPDPIRLKQRDQFALAYRISGAIFGLARCLVTRLIVLEACLDDRAALRRGRRRCGLVPLAHVGGPVSPLCFANGQSPNRACRRATEGVLLSSMRGDDLFHGGLILATRDVRMKF
jgi:hypothetical protein